MRSVLSILVTLGWLLFPTLALMASPRTATLLPSASVAEVDDALASSINPAGLGFGKVFNLHYLRAYDGPFQRDDAIFIGGWGSGFGMEFVESGGIAFNRYTLADGFPVSDHTFLGSAYSWYTSDHPDYDDLNLWQVGGLYRRRYLSFGAAIRNLNRPSLLGERLPRQYSLGVALRPGTERLTLSMDIQKVQDLAGWDFSWGLDLRPGLGLVLGGRLYEDKSFDVRLGWNLAQVGLASYNRFDETQHHQDAVAQLSYAALPYTRPLRKRLILELEPSEIAPVLARAKEDDRVVGALLKLDDASFGFADAQEAYAAMREFKEQGKFLVCFAESYSTRTYLLASLCDPILLHPSGGVSIVGIRAEALFMKDLLDRLGVRADIERIGKYKSATEPLTRQDMSEGSREAENAILDDLAEQLATAIAEGRGWTLEETWKQINKAPYTSWDAEQRGIVDRLVYEDQLEDVLKELAGKSPVRMTASAYSNRRTYPRSWRGPLPRIALIRAEGMINTGKSFRDFITGTRVMGSDTMAKAIRLAREDSRIKAVVLRIDSGGGLVLASDIIWRELMLTREQKPLIVSMGDVAASGGYYIALPGHRVLAQPATITGSIGVIAGKYSLRSLYDKIGVSKTILKRGEHADFYGDYGEYPEEEQRIVQRQVQQLYEDFVRKVAEARGLSFDAVDAVAQGRVWTGKQALAHGLVDELGGIRRAIQIAKERAGLSANAKVQIMLLPRPGWFDGLVNRLTDNLAAKHMLTPTRFAGAAGQAWAWLPYQFR